MIAKFDQLLAGAWHLKSQGDLEASTKAFENAVKLGAADPEVPRRDVVHAALPWARQSWLLAGRAREREKADSNLNAARHALNIAKGISTRPEFVSDEPASAAIVLVTDLRFSAASALVKSSPRSEFRAILEPMETAVETFETRDGYLADMEPDWAAQTWVARVMIAGMARQLRPTFDDPAYADLPGVQEAMRRSSRRTKLLLGRSALVVPPSLGPFRAKLIEAI